MKFFKIMILLAVTVIFSASGWAEDNILKGTRLTDTRYGVPGAAWSPDGKKIIYTNFVQSLGYTDSLGFVLPYYTENGSMYYMASLSCFEIDMISSTGGTPEVIYKPEQVVINKNQINFVFYPYLSFCCFSGDGSEIFFWEYVYDLDRGTTIEITMSGTPDGNFSWSPSIHGAINTLKAINVNTKEVRTIAEQATLPVACSKDDKHIVYSVTENNSFGYPAGSLVSLNTETRQTFLLHLHNDTSANPSSFCITNDSRYIIYNLYGTNALYKMPIEGGNIESVADFQVSPNSLSLSTNGEWLLFQTETDKTDSISYRDGSSSGYSKSTHKEIYAYNLITGKLADLFEGLGFDLSPLNIDSNSSVNYSNPVFSPDGSKFFCSMVFAGITSTGTNEIRDLFVFDFDVNAYLKAISGTAVETAESVPDAFALNGNYPNPFNPTTTIEFSLNKAEKTSLAIYNITGQRVRDILVEANLTPGVHNALWNGKDNSGKTVSSGVYFAKLTAGSNSAVKSMMMVK